MAFVNELISTYDKEKYNIEYSDYWQIDRERSAIFYYKDGNGRGREKTFCLMLNGNNIDVGATWQTMKELDSIEWKNTYASIPEKLKCDKSNILSIIEDALKSYGMTGSGDASKVYVTFDPRMNK